MSGIRTAVALLAATVIAGGVFAHAAPQQQPARGTSSTGSTTTASQPARQGGTASTPAPAVSQPAQGQGQTPSPLPLSQTVRERGSSVTGSFEGWYQGKDGNNYALMGYFNRNTKQEFDIPVGPNNHIDPGGPDQGQPTHFQTGRQRGTFTVKLPKDIATHKVVWTIVANGYTNSVPMQLYPTYIIEPFMNSTTEAVPPVLKFEPNGTSFSGPPIGFGPSFTATLPNPLTLTTYVTMTGGRGRGGAGGGAGGAGGGGRGGGRGAPPSPSTTTTTTTGAAGAATTEPAAGAAAGATANGAAATDPAAAAAGRGGAGGGRGGGRGGRGGGAAAAGAPNAAALAQFGRGGGGANATWTKYRGPGTVTFTVTPPAAGAPPATDGKLETKATFDAPGEYVLRVQSGNPNGEQCCWTNVHVKVTVKAAGAN